jgi:hypothetical protein
VATSAGGGFGGKCSLKYSHRIKASIPGFVLRFRKGKLSMIMDAAVWLWTEMNGYSSVTTWMM